MQPVRLTIYGDFWDSQIYSGRLYLWDMNKALCIYDWDALVDGLSQDNALKLPLDRAFSRGDLLYHPSELLVPKDPDMYRILREEFDLISQREWSLSLSDIGKFLMGQQDSPFDALHDDCTIYYDNIYAFTNSGLYMAKVNKVDRKSEKLWDGLGTSIQPKYKTLAIASAGEGLFEYRLWIDREPKPICDRHTLFVNWSFANIYGSSDISSGYMAEFVCYKDASHLSSYSQISGRGVSVRTPPTSVREFKRIIDENEIFKSISQPGGNNGLLSWGSREKLYLVNPHWVDVVRFRQKGISETDEEHTAFKTIGKIDLVKAGVSNLEYVIAGGVAHFGLIIEHCDYLLVIMSDGQPYIMQYPVVRWRIFPRTKHYVNHLHVILDDRIEIYSFNNDYFVDQRSKKAGIGFNT